MLSSNQNVKSIYKNLKVFFNNSESLNNKYSEEKLMLRNKNLHSKDTTQIIDKNNESKTESLPDLSQIIFNLQNDNSELVLV